MGDILMVFVIIVGSVCLMFMIPMMAVAERNDDIAQTVAQVLVSEFVNDVSVEGTIKEERFEALRTKLEAATGNTYDIEIEVRHIDDNPGKKTTATSQDLIGENGYISVYTTTILDTMYTNGEYDVNKGDEIITSLKNKSGTFAEAFELIVYKVTGKGTPRIVASASSLVVNN